MGLRIKKARSLIKNASIVQQPLPQLSIFLASMKQERDQDPLGSFVNYRFSHHMLAPPLLGFSSIDPFS